MSESGQKQRIDSVHSVSASTLIASEIGAPQKISFIDWRGLSRGRPDDKALYYFLTSCFATSPRRPTVATRATSTSGDAPRRCVPRWRRLSSDRPERQAAYRELRRYRADYAATWCSAAS